MECTQIAATGLRGVSASASCLLRLAPAGGAAGAAASAGPASCRRLTPTAATQVDWPAGLALPVDAGATAPLELTLYEAER